MLYARGWGANRAERAMQDAERNVVRLDEALCRDLGRSVCDEIWASEWKRWSRARWRQRGGLAGAGGTMIAVSGGATRVVAGFVAGFSLALVPRRVRVSDEIVGAAVEGGLLGVLLRRGAGRVVRERWRDLPAGALESRLLRYELTDVLSDLSRHEKQLVEKLGRDFSGTLGELIDAVAALTRPNETEDAASHF